MADAHTHPELDSSRRRHSLALSVVDGLFFAIMMGAGESYLGAFAVELGHRDTALGVLATLPMLCGAVAQLATPWLTRTLGTRQRLVVVGAGMQAASHLLFWEIARSGEVLLLPLLVAKVAFWVSGTVISPAWNSWMGALTTLETRARYFMWRSVVVNAGMLLSFLLAGELLAARSQEGQTLTGFSTLFLVACGARALSALSLSLKAEAPGGGARLGAETVSRLELALRTGPWRVALAMALLMFGAHVSVPYFTPYMLRDLGLDLGVFAWLTATSILAKVLSLPVWHRVAGRIGLRAVLVLSVMGIATVPVLWVPARSEASLVAVQILGGIAWAGFEFASLQLLLGAAPEGASVEFFALSSSLNGVLQLAGALFGSALLSGGLHYRDIFVLSGVLRAVPLILLLPAARPWLKQIRMRRLLLRLVSVRPVAGVERRPVVGFEDEREKNGSHES